MLITQMTLEHFKSYTDRTTIAFRQGTNAIIGANGAGKSSLLEAIGFVLFDHHPSGTTLANLLSEGANAGSVVVRLISSFDEREYEVERCFSERATTRYRVLDPEMDHAVLAESAADVQQWLYEHLCIEPGVELSYLFENTVGVPQGTFTAPFQQVPSVRKATFDPLLRVDEYRRASDNLRSAQGQLRRQVEELSQRIARAEGELMPLSGLRAELERLEAQLVSLRERGEEIERRLEAARQALGQLDAHKRELDRALEEARQAENAALREEDRLSAAREALEEAEAACAQVAQARPGYEAYERAEAELAQLEERRQERDRLNAERAEIELALASQRTRAEQLERELSELAEFARRLAELEPAVTRQELIEAEMAGAERDCGLLGEAERRQRQLREESVRSQAEVEAIEADITQASVLEREAQALGERVEALAQSEREALRDQTAAEAERRRLLRQSETLRQTDTARCPVCEAELTPEHRDELLRRNRIRADELAEAARLAQERLASSRAESAQLTDRRGQIERLLRALRTAADLARTRERLERYVRDEAEARQEAERLADAPRRRERLAEQLRLLGDPRREAQLCQDRLRQREVRGAQRAQALQRVEELSQEIEGLAARLATYAQLEGAMEAARAQRNQNRALYDAYMRHLAVAQQRPARAARVGEAQGRLEAARAHLGQARVEAERLGASYKADEHVRLRDAYQDMAAELAAVRAQTEASDQRHRQVVEEVERLGGLERELADIQREHQRAEAMQGLLERVRSLLREAGPYVTRQLVAQVSRQASLIYADIMSDHTGRLEWSTDYELVLEAKGHQRTFRQLSGGEQMSAALALRLALLRETSDMDVAFFDEPTAHLDPERREGLAERIMQVRGFSQIFVISHDDTFERVAQSCIRIVKDERGSHTEAP
ncbi:MAG: SMC family ATPase [Anaerolineae bacterium]|nr:SMC family ATPase [Anaerolineae bacterium]